MSHGYESSVRSVHDLTPPPRGAAPGSMTFRPPEDRWEPWRVDVCMTGGPERIYDRDPDDDTQRRPVGFTPDWTVDPHPWCDTCCCAPDGCRCPEAVTVPDNVVLGSE